MKRSLFLALASFGLSSLAPAATFNWQPNPTDMGDLDHHLAYTWKITGINLNEGSITSASLFFDNIRNWDSNPNRLFLHLLDTAINDGVASFTDSSGTPVTELEDEFANGNYNCATGGVGECNPLITHPTEPENTHIHTYVNLPTTAQDLTYTFSNGELSALASYIASGGDIAFGMDPDCHYFNDGITFTINTRDTRGGTEAPEPGSVMLLGTVVAGILYRLRKRRVA